MNFIQNLQGKSEHSRDHFVTRAFLLDAIVYRKNSANVIWRPTFIFFIFFYEVLAVRRTLAFEANSTS